MLNMTNENILLIIAIKFILKLVHIYIYIKGKA